MMIKMCVLLPSHHRLHKTDRDLNHRRQIACIDSMAVAVDHETDVLDVQVPGYWIFVGLHEQDQRTIEGGKGSESAIIHSSYGILTGSTV